MCVWHPEADSISFDSKALEIVFENISTSNYLKSTRMLGISGVKGQGKTFLIKAKRKALDNSYILLPKDSVMIDTLDANIRLPKTKLKFLYSYTNWVALWKVAIIISIIQNPYVVQEISENLIKKLSPYTRELIKSENENYRPSVIFSSLIYLEQKSLNCIFSDLSILLQIISNIHTGIAVFIDKTDQAFSQHIYDIPGETASAIGARNASIWQYSQLALANASYDIFSSTNQHIKVYYTIRQEALLDAEDIAPNVFRNFSAYITKIEYSKKDLYDMFSLYIQHESDENLKVPSLKYTNPEQAFTGLKCINHGYVKTDSMVEENVFDYIYRHSMGRASDIQQICHDLYLKNVITLNEVELKHSINNSSRGIIRQYIAELSPTSMFSKESLSDLLSEITTNVFDFEYMKNICKRYKIKRGRTESCKMNCLNCDEVSPFAKMFNIGILGFMYNNQSSPKVYEQKFAMAATRIIKGGTVNMEKSPLYMLHPCISDWAYSIRKNSHRDYINNEMIVVGNNLTCSSEIIQKITDDLNTKKENLKEELVFISSTMKTLSTVRKLAEKAVLSKGYYPLVCENPDYLIDTHVFSHDECIDKILQCGNFITIFDVEYGGAYSGEKYKQYAEEIAQKSQGKISKPSITLMEYYVARKHGKKFLALMNDKITTHAQSSEYLSSKRKKWQNKTDLDKMVIVMNFINKLMLFENDTVPNGNMMKFYKNSNEIINFISNHKFN